MRLPGSRAWAPFWLLPSRSATSAAVAGLSVYRSDDPCLLGWKVGRQTGSPGCHRQYPDGLHSLVIETSRSSEGKNRHYIPFLVEPVLR